jgi:peptidoglycan/xylan/chitin deacetylase (PgdA/CDA1 family)
MYHAVVEGAVNRNINPVHVTLDAFREQMEWLHQHNYRVVSLAEANGLLQSGEKIENVLALTFDDGYLSLYSLVTPILRRYGFQATLFVTTSAVGCKSYAALEGYDPSYPPGDRPLTWSELTDMENSCWSIEAHGHRHLAHSRLTAGELKAEMGTSVRLIEQHLDKKVAFYSFPFGSYNTAALQMVEELGMTAAFSVHPGFAETNSDFRRLPRTEINRRDNIRSFASKVRTGHSGVLCELKARMTYYVYKYPVVKDAMKSFKDALFNRRNKPENHLKCRLNAAV